MFPASEGQSIEHPASCRTSPGSNRPHAAQSASKAFCATKLQGRASLSANARPPICPSPNTWARGMKGQSAIMQYWIGIAWLCKSSSRFDLHLASSFNTTVYKLGAVHGHVDLELIQ